MLWVKLQRAVLGESWPGFKTRLNMPYVGSGAAWRLFAFLLTVLIVSLRLNHQRRRTLLLGWAIFLNMPLFFSPSRAWALLPAVGISLLVASVRCSSNAPVCSDEPPSWRAAAVIVAMLLFVAEGVSSRRYRRERRAALLAPLLDPAHSSLRFVVTDTTFTIHGCDHLSRHRIVRPGRLEVCTYCGAGCRVHGVDNNQRAAFFGRPAIRAGIRSGCSGRSGLSASCGRRPRPRGDHGHRARRSSGAHRPCGAQPSHDRAAPFRSTTSRPMRSAAQSSGGGGLLRRLALRAHVDEQVYGDLPNTIALTELPTRWITATEVRARIPESFSIDQSTTRCSGVEGGGDVLVQNTAATSACPRAVCAPGA